MNAQTTTPTSKRGTITLTRELRFWTEHKVDDGNCGRCGRVMVNHKTGLIDASFIGYRNRGEYLGSILIDDKTFDTVEEAVEEIMFRTQA